MSLVFNMLSKLVITVIPRSKHLSFSWLQSPSAVVLESKKNSVTVSIVSPSVCHEVMGPDYRKRAPVLHPSASIYFLWDPGRVI